MPNLREVTPNGASTQRQLRNVKTIYDQLIQLSIQAFQLHRLGFETGVRDVRGPTEELASVRGVTTEDQRLWRSTPREASAMTNEKSLLSQRS
jgi:hypothetical protein